MALSYYDRNLRLDYACLFKGYLRQGVAEHIAMVQSYVRNDAENRRHYVRAVQTASQACFQHDDIGFHIGEPAECKRSRYFEEGHVKMVECLLPLIDE